MTDHFKKIEEKFYNLEEWTETDRARLIAEVKQLRNDIDRLRMLVENHGGNPDSWVVVGWRPGQ
jgi:hypothetical protein